MKRLTIRLAALVAAAGLVGLLAGCNLQWSPYAAKVSGKVISQGQLDDALHHASSDAGFSCLLEASSTGGYRLSGAGTDTYDSSFAAFVLTDLIDAEVARDVVAAGKVSVPAGAESLARQQVEAALSSEVSQSGCTAPTSGLLSGLGKSLAGSVVRLQLDEDALALRAAHVPFDAAGVSAYEAAHPVLSKESCLAGLFLKTEKEASQVRAKLAGGASFTAVLKQYSPDSLASGGSLGCYTDADLAEISPTIEAAVAPAKIGVFLAPISYQSAYLVAEVTSRPYEPAVDALDEIFSLESSAFSKAIVRGVKRSSVEVDPEYGRWVVTKTTSQAGAVAGFGGRVEPPKGPALSLVLNPAAVRGKENKVASASSGG